MNPGKKAVFRENTLIDYMRRGWPVDMIVQDVLRRLHGIGFDVSDPSRIRFERRGNDAHFSEPPSQP